MNKAKRGPLAHIVKRPAMTWYQAMAIRAAAIVLAILVCSVITVILTDIQDYRRYIEDVGGESAGKTLNVAKVIAELRKIGALDE